MSNKFRISIINGPNLNLLGFREPNKYGNVTLKDIINNLNKLSIKLGINIEHFQSNSESSLINYIHKNSINSVDCIIINPAALTHTSIALRDALLAVNVPFIEIHLSNIYTRENFRHYSYLSDIAIGVICGFLDEVYYLALRASIKYLLKNKKVPI